MCHFLFQNYNIRNIWEQNAYHFAEQILPQIA